MHTSPSREFPYVITSDSKSEDKAIGLISFVSFFLCRQVLPSPYLPPFPSFYPPPHPPPKIFLSVHVFFVDRRFFTVVSVRISIFPLFCNNIPHRLSKFSQSWRETNIVHRTLASELAKRKKMIAVYHITRA